MPATSILSTRALLTSTRLEGPALLSRQCHPHAAADQRRERRAWRRRPAR